MAKWAKVDRNPGQSFDSWLRTNREAHLQDWIAKKIDEGKWLDSDAFQAAKGRPGRPLKGWLNAAAQMAKLMKR